MNWLIEVEKPHETWLCDLCKELKLKVSIHSYIDSFNGLKVFQAQLLDSNKLDMFSCVKYTDNRNYTFSAMHEGFTKKEALDNLALRISYKTLLLDKEVQLGKVIYMESAND